MQSIDQNNNKARAHLQPEHYRLFSQQKYNMNVRSNLQNISQIKKMQTLQTKRIPHIVPYKISTKHKRKHQTQTTNNISYNPTSPSAMSTYSTASTNMSTYSALSSSQSSVYSKISYASSSISSQSTNISQSSRTPSPNIQNIQTQQIIPNSKTNKTKQKHRRISPKKVTYIIENITFKIWEYYRPTKVIGVGAYGVVIEALDVRSNKFVAIKKNQNIFADLEDSRRIYREVLLLQHFHHQNVINLIDIIPPSNNECFTFNEMYLVMPRIDSNLKQVILSQNLKLLDHHKMFIVFQCLCALQYIHSSGVIHRDLTPQNILIDSKLHIRIIDFGLSRGILKSKSDKSEEKLTEYVCTRWYRAPEIMVSKQRYSFGVDVWSVACIFAELILMRPLFESNNHFELLSRMFQILGTPSTTTNESDWITDKDALAWIKSSVPVSYGCDLRKLFNTTVPEAVDVLSKMLVLNPARRCNAEEALSHPYFHRYQEYARKNGNKKCKKYVTDQSKERAFNTLFGARQTMFDELCSFVPKNKYQNWFKKPNTPNQSYSFLQSPTVVDPN